MASAPTAVEHKVGLVSNRRAVPRYNSTMATGALAIFDALGIRGVSQKHDADEAQQQDDPAW